MTAEIDILRKSFVFHSFLWTSVIFEKIVNFGFFTPERQDFVAVADKRMVCPHFVPEFCTSFQHRKSL